jgi:zinc protease
MPIAYEKRTLDNGLDVVVHEERALPVVAVNLWYHVGSKNERPGGSGFAHLFEHLMFEGSAHHDRGYFEPLQEIGGVLNGSTSADRTNYWEVVPTGAVDRAMWLESDRMGFLLPALTEEKFETQRKVVLNERRQNYENRPYGLASMALMHAMYPEGHPYRWLPIGARKDIEQADFDAVREFFSSYYHPANASLVLAGDIELNHGHALAAHYFGDIPAGPPAPALSGLPAARVEPVRLSLEDQVELPRLYLSWPSPALFGPGDAALDITATILAGGKSSRLYRELVHTRQIATDVGAGQGSRELSGTFSIVATAAPGHTLDELDDVLTTELRRMCDDGPTLDEVARTQTSIEADFAYRFQTVGGFGGRSDQLNAYNVYTGDPGYFDADLARYLDLSPDAVRTVTHRYLAETPAVALSVTPTGSPSSMALAGSEDATARVAD